MALLTPGRVSLVPSLLSQPLLGLVHFQPKRNKTHPKIIPHAEGNHRESLSAAQRIYFNILAFDINKTKAVQDSLFCLLSNEHQHDNYIKIDWFKNVYSN